jgi:hypothetical protein
VREVNGKVRFPFKELAIGFAFRFASEEDMPFSGMKTGPWRKLSARKYRHEIDGMVCRVGSWSVEVIPDDQTGMFEAWQ